MLENSNFTEEDFVTPKQFRELERRVSRLEVTLNSLEQTLQRLEKDVKYDRSRPVLPESNLFSDSFMTRAFAIWGHLFIANLIITVPFYCLLFLLSS